MKHASCQVLPDCASDTQEGARLARAHSATGTESSDPFLESQIWLAIDFRSVGATYFWHRAGRFPSTLRRWAPAKSAELCNERGDHRD